MTGKFIAEHIVDGKVIFRAEFENTIDNSGMLMRVDFFPTPRFRFADPFWPPIWTIKDVPPADVPT